MDALYEKQRIKSAFLAKGQYLTSAQVDEYYNNLKSQSEDEGYGFIGQDETIYDAYNDDGVVKNILEGAANAVWSGVDTALIGAPGWAWKAIDEGSYESAMEELNDSALGRVGGTLGGLAGFLAPMGVWGKGMSAVTRTVRGTSQAKAIAGGKKLADIASPTTRALQAGAGSKLYSETLKYTQKVGGSLSKSEAQNIAKAVSDDVIGFSTDGLKWYQKIMGGGKAYQLEHSVEHLNNARNVMKSIMPERLAAELSKAGVKNLTEKQILKMSDDMIELLGSKPFNSLESIIQGAYSGTIATPALRVLGGMAQEAVQFGLVGASMDAVQYGKGDLDLSDDTYFDKVMSHLITGAAFGAVKFIPGGVNNSILNPFKASVGKHVKSINKKIDKMSLDEAKAFARNEMKNDRSYLLNINGQNVLRKSLRKGVGIKKEQLSALKTSMKQHNINMAKDFNGPKWSKLIKEGGRDLIGSLPRMAMGSAIMNYHAMEDGAFDYLSPLETGFHFALGALITKKHKPVFEGTVPRTGFHFGERPYHYASELTAIKQGLDRMNVYSHNIGDLVKQFDGNLYTDWVNRNQIQDVENIITTLMDNNVIYDKSNGPITPKGVTALTNRELLDLINPVTAVMTSRNLALNPNSTKAEHAKALDSVKNLVSEELTTAAHTRRLDSSTNIRQAVLSGSQKSITKFQRNTYELFEQMHDILSNKQNSVDEGVLYDFNLNYKHLDITDDQRIAIRKFQDLTENLKDEGIITLRDIEHSKQKGLQYELTHESINKIDELSKMYEQTLGQELYGKSMGIPADLNDPMLWNLAREVNYQKNVANVVDVIGGKEIPGLEKVDAGEIKSLVQQVLSNSSSRNDVTMTDSPLKIEMEFPDDWGGSTAQQQALQQFTLDLWSIGATKRAPVDGRKVVISAGKVTELKEKLVKAGMPDPEHHMLDTRMATWVEKAISHGIDQATYGMDLDPHVGLVIKKLMKNGIISVAEDSAGRGVRLVAPESISADQVNRMMPSLSKIESQEYVDAYKSVLSRISHKAVARKKDFNITHLTSEQLTSIRTADRILNKEKLVTDTEKNGTEHLQFIERAQARKTVLEETLTSLDMSSSDASEVRAMMEFENEKIGVFNDAYNMFRSAYAGGKEITRISAYLDFMGSTPHAGSNKKYYDYLKELERAETKEEFIRLTDELSVLREQIATNVANRSDVLTSWDERRQNLERVREQREIEGIVPGEKTHTTPDMFFEKHGIERADIFQFTDPEHGITYDSNSDALYALYARTLKGGSRKDFVDRVIKLTGVDTPNRELRDDIMVLSNLFERRFNIKRVTMNTSSGKAIFENSEISKGFLTDVFTEVFGNTPLMLLDPQYMEKGSIKSLYSNPRALKNISQQTYNEDFMASLSKGGNKYIKTLSSGVAKPGVGDMFHGIPIDEQTISGAHYPIIIDENITILLPDRGFESLGKSFKKWFERVRDEEYTRKSIKSLPGAKELFNNLESYYNTLKNTDGSMKEFVNSRRGSDQESVHDAFFTIFNAIYGERIDHDWLQDAYTSSKGQRKHFKYKRLAQNQGYSRNSNERKEFAKILYGESDNAYHRELINEFTDQEYTNAFVINDGMVSEKGMNSNGLITDNRSVSEFKLKEMYKNKEISKGAYEEMIKLLKDSNSINAEYVNGGTPVNRRYLDYILLQNGDSSLIGKSSGQKPVGLSSYKDNNGVIHVLYNKTHYFYDSRLDPFFEKNPDIHMIAFTSGAKKAKRINPNESLENQFIPYDAIPKVDSGMNLNDMINELKIDNIDNNKSVMRMQADQSLSGTIYGEPHDAKILKQFSNWTSPKVQRDIYQYARADMIDKFADINVQFFNIENTALASAEARSFIRTKGNKDGTISVETDNASFESIWIEGDGVPFSIANNLYESMIKRRYIDDAGIFDGHTDAGGSAILRGNMSMDLNIPVYENNKQIKIGEANISEVYLDRKIHNIADYGQASLSRGKGKRPKHKAVSTISIILEANGRDVVYDLKSGRVYDPKKPTDGLEFLGKGSKIPDYEALEWAVKKLRAEMSMKEGGISTYRDVLNFLNNFQAGDTGKKVLKLGIMGLPAPRTGPHDAILLKVKGTLSKRDGGIMEVNPYDLTMRAQRDFDTDKMYFYMDTPFSAMRESYKVNGQVKEALPVDRPAGLELNPYDRRSMENYSGEINNYRKKFGQVVKTHRKLTYARNVFEQIKSINIGDGREIVFQELDDMAMQRLVSDTQGAVDIYETLPFYVKNFNQWQRNTFFGNNRSDRSTIADKPFFYIKSKDGSSSRITEDGHMLIVEKLMGDFGRLLSYEGNVWEAGEAKTPRYKDMVTALKIFRDEYRPDRINHNYYNYIKYKFNEEVANQIFYENSNTKKSMNDILGPLSKAINDSPDPFLRSLKGIASRDRMQVRETYSPSGDHFNAALDRLIGERRGEALAEALRGGDTESRPEETIILEQMWEAFYKTKKTEDALVQANTIEEQIGTAEFLIRKEQMKSDENRDDAFIQVNRENIQIKRKALSLLLNKMTVSAEEGLPGQSIQKYKSDGNNLVEVFGDRQIAIKDAETGQERRMLRNAGDKHELKKGEVAVRNPVILKAIKEHDLIDGIAFAHSTLGYYSGIATGDMDWFGQYARKTKGRIRKLMVDTMDNSNVKEWDKYENLVRHEIEKGLQDVVNKLYEEVPASLKQADLLPALGNLPDGKESYGIDFLMSMLTPDHSGNPNQFYFSPKTGGFMPAVKAPSKSVIKAVFNFLNDYSALPHKKEFIQKFAQVHRGFYDALVAGNGFESGMSRIADANFEGALINSLNKKVMNSPFVSREEFKKISEYMEIGSGINSEFAELMQQMLIDGQVIDAGTAIRIKENIINEVGENEYKALFKVARGSLVFDGLSTKQFSTSGGEGQLIGEVLMDRKSIKQRRITGIRPQKRGTKILDLLNDEIGFENEHGASAPIGKDGKPLCN